MKKILLLSLMGSCVLSAYAQRSNQKMVNESKLSSTASQAQGPVEKKATSKSYFKTTGVPFYTETFASGTPNTLPTGWTVGSLAPLPSTAPSWKWRKTATTGIYNIGVINSTTASDGWMVYDCDSIGKLFPTTTPIGGWLMSPSINCSAHTSVQIAFQEHFRRFQDSCFVDVSNNGGASWTTYPVKINNNLSFNSYPPSNPYTVKINISPTAANQANVNVRFRYSCTYLTGTYNWIVDDVVLSELDPVELVIDNSSVVMQDGAGGFTSFASIPRQLIDTLIPVVNITNEGSTAPTGIAVNAKIFQGATQVYNQNNTLTSLAPGVQDSILDFPPYVTSTSAVYTAAFSINPTGDANTANNTDTTLFIVSDSIYHRNLINNNSTITYTASYYIHRAPGTSTERSFSIGQVFDIPAGKSDTLTGITAAFQSTTTPNSKVVANIFKFDGTSWNIIGYTKEKTLTAADISTTGNVVYTRFTIDPVLNPLIMDAGEYAVVIQGKNVPASSTVLLLVTAETTPFTLNYLHGVTDTSNNDGLNGFGGTGNLPSRLAASPAVRLHFAKLITIGINDVTAVSLVGNAYPNPAKSKLFVPFNVNERTEVKATLTNTLGQVVSEQIVGKFNAKESGKATFDVSQLSNGVYFYTIEANGQQLTRKVAVSH
jgi:hypothetical protein